eukprot:1152684-Pelagomonas_calceolata.AAC.2
MQGPLGENLAGLLVKEVIPHARSLLGPAQPYWPICIPALHGTAVATYMPWARPLQLQKGTRNDRHCYTSGRGLLRMDEQVPRTCKELSALIVSFAVDFKSNLHNAVSNSLGPLGPIIGKEEEKEGHKPIGYVHDGEVS